MPDDILEDMFVDTRLRTQVHYALLSNSLNSLLCVCFVLVRQGHHHCDADDVGWIVCVSLAACCKKEKYKQYSWCNSLSNKSRSEECSINYLGMQQLKIGKAAIIRQAEISIWEIIIVLITNYRE